MMRNPLRKTKAPKKIELNDLARAFWLDKPAGKAQSKTVSNKGNSSERSWENKDIEEFWQHYVMPHRKILSQPIFETIKSLLSEIERLPECPSVIKGDEETPQKYLELSGVSLLAHTLNVCREIVDLLKAKENDFELNAGKALIAALGHDIGKHPTAHMPHIIEECRPCTVVKKIGCDEGERLTATEEGYYYCNDSYLGHAKTHSKKGVSVENFKYDGIVPEGEFFAIGSCPDSYDSRYIGLLKKKDVEAVAIPIF